MNTALLGRAFSLAYRELVTNRSQHLPFWVLVGFLPTFLFTRALVHYAPNLFLSVHGVHVHHFTYGVFVLAIVGFISIVAQNPPARRWLALFYGVGLALAFDEFGMWLRLANEYNLDQSEDVMVGILVFLVIAVYFTGLLRRAFRIMRRL
jgi:hypothetical protein